MFCSTPTVYYPGFQVEACFDNLEQIECYKARAKALAHRFPWSDALRPVWTASLVHLSQNVPGKVAYFANIKALMENRLTRTSPEMFLTRQLKVAPETIQAAWEVEVLGKTLPQLLFVTNTDPDGWEDVYDRGPHSCMSGRSMVRQYAHPKSNLELAYVEAPNGVVTHRTIVNKKRKTYVRPYGQDPGYFIAALNKAGFKQDDDTLEGEYIYLGYTSCSDCDRDMLHGPYFDGSTGNGVKVVNKLEGIIGGCNTLYYAESNICERCEYGEGDDDDEE